MSFLGGGPLYILGGDRHIFKVEKYALTSTLQRSFFKHVGEREGEEEGLNTFRTRNFIRLMGPAKKVEKIAQQEPALRSGSRRRGNIMRLLRGGEECTYVWKTKRLNERKKINNPTD